MPAPSAASTMDNLRVVIKRYWGFDGFRPLQEPAMRAVLEGRDSLVVMPTGAGKSLCYQAPAVVRGDTMVVVSPLIALMKDQVDRLRSCGIAAAALNSSQTREDWKENNQSLLEGSLRLVFVSPERLAQSRFQELLQRLHVRSIAIDEAHCISHWGHDFRPDYRQLSRLREFFPEASIHAFTATATQRVRQDIIGQLQLRDPEVLVGNFDRPNLTYRVEYRKTKFMPQVKAILRRHPGEAGIIYCIRRKEVDELAAELKQQGVKAVPYHAGMADLERKAAQNAFIHEECDIVVATVAFGMGIDRSNVRFVIHQGMPKSLEHYQQEAGRAGRDGLEAECVLLYSERDVRTWQYILRQPVDGKRPAAEVLASNLGHLDQIQAYCTDTLCRHRALVEHFGQPYRARSCGACDRCLGDGHIVADSLVIAQKILSCVARVEQRFSADHVVEVLLGSRSPGVEEATHHLLSTFALLSDHKASNVQDWIKQLHAQGLLDQGEGRILRLNDASWEVMRGQRPANLIERTRKQTPQSSITGRPKQTARASRNGPPYEQVVKPPKIQRRRKQASSQSTSEPAQEPAVKQSRAELESWKGVDRDLFNLLCIIRHWAGQERNLPPDAVFSDLTLRELARIKPSNLDEFRQIQGIGEAKSKTFGQAFLKVIGDWVRDHGGKIKNPGS